MDAIKLKCGESSLLRRLSHNARTAHGLTHADGGAADVQIAPNIVRQYLDHLATLGLIAPPARFDGKYAITEEGLEWLAQVPAIAPSRYFGNASVPSSVPYRTPAWAVREGGDAHKQFASRGV